MVASVLYTNFGGMLVHEDRGGVHRTYAHDEMGNTSYLLDDNGITDSYEYTPYGTVKSHTGSAVTPFTFIGALGYFSTGLSQFSQYVRARWYSANTGNWGSKDPLWPRQKAYAYVDGNPAMATDPSGLIVPLLCAVACAGCLICLAGFISSCNDCGWDTECWINCVVGIWNALPLWAKLLCGALCAGCIACLLVILIRLLRRLRPPKVKQPVKRYCPDKYHTCLDKCERRGGYICKAKFWEEFLAKGIASNEYLECIQNNKKVCMSICASIAFS